MAVLRGHVNGVAQLQLQVLIGLLLACSGKPQFQVADAASRCLPSKLQVARQQGWRRQYGRILTIDPHLCSGFL